MINKKQKKKRMALNRFFVELNMSVFIVVYSY